MLNQVQERRVTTELWQRIVEADEAVTAWIALHPDEAERLAAIRALAARDHAAYTRRLATTLAAESSAWRDTVQVLGTLIAIHHQALETYWSTTL